MTCASCCSCGWPPASTLDEDLEKRIRAKIRSGASPRHVPAKIVAVTDIPRTKSGKITELAVRDVVHGRAIKNKEALANPEALELFRNLPQTGGLRPAAEPWLTKYVGRIYLDFTSGTHS